MPIRVSMKRFRRLVTQALDDLPPEFRRHLKNVEVVVELLPPPELQGETDDLLLGLYHGTPLPERSILYPSPPDVISIYKSNIEEICSTEEEIQEEITLTVLHEIGHHFGLSEDELLESGY